MSHDLRDSWPYLLASILFIALVLTRGVCVPASRAVEAAETMGFKKPVVQDAAWFAVGLRGCSSHDAARFTVSAINPAGKRVEVYVCTGWLLKGSTIRTNY